MNPYSPEIRRKYLPLAAQRYQEEYDEGWDPLPRQTKNLYLTYIIVEELGLDSSFIARSQFNKNRLKGLEKSKKSSPKEILRGWLAVISGLLVFVCGGYFVIKFSMNLIDNPIELPDPNTPVMVPQTLGFFVLLCVSALVGVSSFGVGFYVYGPDKLQGVWKTIYTDLKEFGKWGIIGLFIICTILFLFLWWFSVSMIPWYILFAPTILMAFSGKRR